MSDGIKHTQEPFEHRHSAAMPADTDIRSPLCMQFERFLDEVLKDQSTAKSYAFKVLSREYGVSVTASIMQAADVRRLQKERPRVG